MLEWLEPQEYSAWRREVSEAHMTRHFTKHRRDALLGLVTCLSTNTEATYHNIAAIARVCRKTVQRAIADAVAIGWLRVTPGPRKLDDRGQWRQGPNVYTLLRADPARLPACDAPGGQRVRAKKESNKERRPTRSVAAQIAAIGGIPAGVPSLAAIAEGRRGVIGRVQGFHLMPQSLRGIPA